MAGLVVGVGDGGYSSDPDKCDHKQNNPLCQFVSIVARLGI